MKITCCKLSTLAIIAASLLAGTVCTLIQTHYQRGAGDLGWLLGSGRIYLAGGDPYDLVLDNFQIAYPFPATLVALPLTPLPDTIAAGVFTALATAALLWGGRRVSPWAWLIILSAPFWQLVRYVNLTLLVAAVYYVPRLGWILPAKPNTGLPMVLTSRGALLSAACMGLLSLLLYPTWPLVWLAQAQLDVYVGRPLIQEPLGFLSLVLLLFVHRSPDARYLLLVCLVPLREFYDPILLLLIARQRQEWLLLITFSWIMFFADRLYDVPFYHWGTLVWFFMGIPALLIVVYRCIVQPIEP